MLEVRKEGDYRVPTWIIVGSTLGGLLLLALLSLALWKVKHCVKQRDATLCKLQLFPLRISLPPHSFVCVYAQALHSLSCCEKASCANAQLWRVWRATASHCTE